MLKLNVSQNPANECAKEMAKDLIKRLATGQKVLWMVSGGSAEAVYNEMLEFLPPVFNYSNLTIAMADERWDMEPHHPQANWVVLTCMPLFVQMRDQGVNFYQILKGQDMEKDAQQFSQFLEASLAEHQQVILLAGIGADGHTFGIIPTANQVDFDATYKTEAQHKFVWHHQLDSKFKGRISLNPEFLRKVDRVFAYAVGPDKKEIIKKLASPQLGGDIYQHPAQILNTVQTELYTDQTVES